VSLQLQIGQYSTAGRQAVNQDFVDFCVPTNTAQLQDKGAVFAIADGIGSSQVSQIASETAVCSFILDYLATNPAWSVQHAAQQVLQACHRWLYQQNKQSSYRQDPDKGYCCAFSALVLRQQQAHLFHIGDCRIYQFRQRQLTQLTRDQRVWQANQLLLSQALGAQPQLTPDCLQLDLAVGDLYLLATDGFFEFIEQSKLAQLLADTKANADLSLIARQLIEIATANGSDDNISVQLVLVKSLPHQLKLPGSLDEDLPLPPILQPGCQIDGLTVLDVISQNHRSHLYLVALANSEKAVLKAPSLELADDNQYLEKLLREEWIANRVHSPFIMRAAQTEHQRTAIYSLFEYVPGQTLADWRLTQPVPELETVLQITEQIGKALQALHRAEILHQDIRPQNVILDPQGQIRVIDFGAARLAGLQPDLEVAGDIPGTALFTAPEYFTGQAGTARSDLYALAALCYFLLTGQTPYGPDIARCKSLQTQQRLSYQPMIGHNADWPEWLDLTLQKALQVDPAKRYQHLSEFLYDLRHPNPSLGRELTLQAAYPMRIWQTICFVQALLIALLLSIS
jgi:protein phosphatase